MIHECSNRNQNKKISFKRLSILIKRYNKSFKRDIFPFDLHSNFLVSMSILVKDRKGNVPSWLPYLCLVSSPDTPNDFIRVGKKSLRN